MKRVAVVGGGISGIMAAREAARRFRVTLIEAAPKLGGHVHTARVGFGPDRGLPVDMGFIVLNERTYPTFIRLLTDLGVGTAPTDMSFAYRERDTGFAYSGTGLGGLFHRKKNVVDPVFWKMLTGYLAFARKAKRDLDAGFPPGEALVECLRRYGSPDAFRDKLLVPMTQAVWSASANHALSQPAEPFCRFFWNHGLLTPFDRPVWRYIPGGSERYVRAFAATFAGTIRVDCPIKRVERIVDGQGPGVLLSGPDLPPERFDAVILACHADQVREMLATPTDAERDGLVPWVYAKNRVTLHDDPRFLSPDPRGRAAWNVFAERAPDGSSNHAGVQVHYWMNRLQRLPTPRDYTVSLNSEIDPARIVETAVMAHPQYNDYGLAARDRLTAWMDAGQTGRVLYAGAWLGAGFHEDGALSGKRAAERLDNPRFWGDAA